MRTRGKRHFFGAGWSKAESLRILARFRAHLEKTAFMGDFSRVHIFGTRRTYARRKCGDRCNRWRIRYMCTEKRYTSKSVIARNRWTFICTTSKARGNNHKTPGKGESRCNGLPPSPAFWFLPPPRSVIMGARSSAALLVRVHIPALSRRRVRVHMCVYIYPTRACTYSPDRAPLVTHRSTTGPALRSALT
jgi:hypothetical protein